MSGGKRLRMTKAKGSLRMTGGVGFFDKLRMSGERGSG